MQFLLHITVIDPSNAKFQAGLNAERAKAAEFVRDGTWEAFYAPKNGSLGLYAVHTARSAEEVQADLQALPLIDYLDVTITPLQADPLGLM